MSCVAVGGAPSPPAFEPGRSPRNCATALYEAAAAAEQRAARVLAEAALEKRKLTQLVRGMADKHSVVVGERDEALQTAEALQMQMAVLKDRTAELMTKAKVSHAAGSYAVGTRQCAASGGLSLLGPQATMERRLARQCQQQAELSQELQRTVSTANPIVLCASAAMLSMCTALASYPKPLRYPGRRQFGAAALRRSGDGQARPPRGPGPRVRGVGRGGGGRARAQARPGGHPAHRLRPGRQGRPHGHAAGPGRVARGGPRRRR